MNEKIRRFAERYSNGGPVPPPKPISLIDRLGEVFYGQQSWNLMMRRARRKAMMEKFLQNVVMLCVAAAAVIGVIALVRWVF